MQDVTVVARWDTAHDVSEAGPESEFRSIAQKGSRPSVGAMQGLESIEGAGKRKGRIDRGWLRLLIMLRHQGWMPCLSMHDPIHQPEDGEGGEG